MVPKEPNNTTMVHLRCLTPIKRRAKLVANNTKANAGTTRVATPVVATTVTIHYSSKKQTKFINEMFKSHSSNTKEKSDSDSKSSAADWKKGINQVQQMYIAQQYRVDNCMDSEEDVKSIEGDQLKSLTKKTKKIEKALKRS